LQAKMIGIGLFLLFVVGAITCALNEDWETLKLISLLAGALVLSLGLLSGTAWLLVRIFTRKRKDEASPRRKGHT
jgi:hypothetical protein